MSAFIGISRLLVYSAVSLRDMTQKNTPGTHHRVIPGALSSQASLPSALHLLESFKKPSLIVFCWKDREERTTPSPSTVSPSKTPYSQPSNLLTFLTRSHVYSSHRCYFFTNLMGDPKSAYFKAFYS